MNVSLTPDLEQKMKRHAASGRFGSPGEVKGEGLRLLEELEEWEELGLAHWRAQIAVGLDQLKRGEGRPGASVFPRSTSAAVPGAAGRRRIASLRKSIPRCANWPGSLPWGISAAISPMNRCGFGGSIPVLSSTGLERGHWSQRHEFDDAKISQSKPEGMPVVVPSLTERRRIVARLDARQAEVDALKRRPAETAAELDALPPTSSTAPSKENYEYSRA